MKKFVIWWLNFGRHDCRWDGEIVQAEYLASYLLIFISVDVDAIHERTGDTLLVALHKAHGVGAQFAIITIESANVGLHGHYQVDIGREGQQSAGPADGDDAILQQLA